MPTIATKRINAIAQRAMREDMKVLFTGAAAQIGVLVNTYASPDGKVPQNNLSRLQSQAGQVIERLFVGSDGRSAYGDDGVTPLAPYPRLLNKYYIYVVAETVVRHAKWMSKNLPEDVFSWLQGIDSRPAPVSETGKGGLYSPSINRRVVEVDGFGSLTPAQIEELRIFHPNPLAEYDPMHTWVDPRGYRLSDRIWRTDIATRQKLDAMLADLVREGRGADYIARQIEQFLIPGRAKLRTNKPYGTDASYDAMRLARTEIARAANQASYIAGYLNPYTSGIDIVRSPNGDATCQICPQHVTINFGTRTKPPYDYGAAIISPYHPHCMCYCVNVLRDTPDTVTRNLRAIMADADRRELKPYTTPAQYQSLIEDLIGRSLMRMIAQYYQLPLAF